MTEPLSANQMAKADVVFEGRAVQIKTEKCAKDCSSKIVGPRVVTFEIEKVVEGKKIKGPIEVYWQNGNFGEVDDLKAFQARYGERSRVGVILSETINKSIRCETVPATTGLGKPTTVERCQTDLPLPVMPRKGMTTDKPWIISGLCTEAFLKKIGK